MRAIPGSVPVRRFAAVVALVAFSSVCGGQAALAAPDITRESGGTVPPCYGAAGGGASVFYVCDCATTGSAGAQPTGSTLTGGQQPDTGCTVGNDALAGTSPATAWRTFGKIQSTFGSLAAGDRIMLCNGGVWDESGASSTRFVNRNASAGNRVVVASYQATWGGSHRPLIMAATGTYAIDLNDGSDTARGGYIFAGIHFQGIGMPSTPTESSPMCGGSHCPFEAFFVFNQVSNVYICDVRMSYFSIGIENGGGNVGTEDNQNIVVQYSTFDNNEGQGALGSTTNATFDSSTFTNNGFGTANLDHHIYLSSGGQVGELVTNNHFYKGSQISGGCANVEIVMHGINNGTTIAGNLIEEDAATSGAGCYGIGIMPGYTTHEEFNNIVIKSNVIKNVGGSGVEMSACHTCTVENNILIADVSSGFEGITLTNDGEGGGGVTDQDNQTVKVINNTGYGRLGNMVRTSDAGTVLTIANNVVLFSNTTGTVTAFNHSLSDSAYAYMNYNWAATAGAAITWNATGTLSRASECSGHSFDCNSTSGTAPSFTNARISTSYAGAASDFTPMTGSLLIAGGNAANGATIDWFGAARPNPPSIGALEAATVAFSAGNGSASFFGGF